jgi:AraC-like DNA-binding protein
MKENPIKLSPENVSPLVRHSNYISVSPGTFWGPRKIQEFELILIVSGTFSYTMHENNKTFMLQEGKTLCIEPGKLHTFKCEGETRSHAAISCAHMELSEHGSFMNGDYMPSPYPELVTDTSGDVAIHELFRNCREAFEGLGRFREQLLKTMAKEIWLRLAEYWENGSDRQLSDRMRRMMLYIQKNINSKPTRNDLAKNFHITPEHINTLFKKELGMTPTKYQQRIRIYSACSLLREKGLSIKEAAEETGFCDEFHFSKVFKKIMGAPPSKFK